MNTQELWQCYDEQGQPIMTAGATREAVFAGLLHGSAHVWIWRRVGENVEVLLQKRAAGKQTWPNLYDISAAGHIDYGETPIIAARRETKEEIGLDLSDTDLRFIGVHRTYMVAGQGDIENELRWLYLHELSTDIDFNLQTDEVESLIWKPLEVFATECTGLSYVPHAPEFYALIVTAIRLAARS